MQCAEDAAEKLLVAFLLLAELPSSTSLSVPSPSPLPPLPRCRPPQLHQHMLRPGGGRARQLHVDLPLPW